MRQAGHNDEKHTDDHHRAGAEARHRLLDIKHPRNEEHTDSTEKHQVSTQFGEQQDCKHRQHRDNCNPRMQIKTQKLHHFHSISLIEFF